FNHRAVEQLSVPNQLRHGLRNNESLYRALHGLAPVAYLIEAVAGDPVVYKVQQVSDLDGVGVDVLVADGGCGIDAVDYYLRPVLAQSRNQHRAPIGII